MAHGKKKRLILFSNTFPYGSGETFLAQELPYLAERFDEVVIFPLYIPTGSGSNSDSVEASRPEVRCVPANVVVEEPLLPFDHKDRKRLLIRGVFSLSIQPYALRELSVRVILGKESTAAWRSDASEKAPLIKRLWIYADYLLMLRVILGRKKLMKKILERSICADILYFYWGDKSVLIAKALKKSLNKALRNSKQGKGESSSMDSVPAICARFHGSDLYERAKGYLPFRKEIFRSLDYAVPVSYDGEKYIRENYPDALPKNLKTHHLGSFRDDSEAECRIEGYLTENNPQRKLFRIVSCSNVIELKRVSLILEAIKLIYSDKESVERLKGCGWSGISWKHFGDGVLLESLKTEAEKFLTERESDDFEASISFAGRVRHEAVLEYYRRTGGEVFILTSRSEGVPVSIMEAMSFGIPVIATNVGGVSELFDFPSPVGELITSTPTARNVAEALLEFMMLSEKNHANLRSNAYANWRENWNAAKNYSVFAESIASL